MITPKKQKVIDAATKLFCEYGYHATGVDTVIREAGTAKMTLYSNFKTKEDLIIECLQQLDRQAFEWFENAVLSSSADARERLYNIFKILPEFLSLRPFYGCPFIRASMEYPDRAERIHSAAAAYKKRMRTFFEKLAAEAGESNPKKTALQIQIVMEGTMAMVQLTGDKKLALEAGDILYPQPHTRGRHKPRR